MAERERLPDTPDQPFTRLEPLVAALLSGGSRLVRPGQGGSPFGPSPEGYISVLSEPIDWGLLTERFSIPPDVRYDASRDVVLDDTHWTAVYGSSGARAAQG